MAAGEAGEVDLVLIGPVTYGVAAFLVLRVPENRISWLLLAVALGFALTSFYWLPGRLGEVPNFLGIFALILPGLAVFLPLWFPTGRPPTRRWRWVEIGGYVAVAAFAASVAIGILGGDFDDDVDGCYSVSSCAEFLSVLALLALMLAAVAALVVRWARSTGAERQQLKVMMYAFSVFVIAAAVQFGGGQGLPVADELLTLGLLLIPMAIALAVARYRLYDIDRIISRTVSYALVAGILALVFAAGVVWIPSALGLGDSQLLVAASTLAVAALFNPIRKRVRSWVDRRFNRSRYDAEQVIDQFAGSLRDRVDPDGVVDGWVGVVSETMQPSSVGVWVKE